MRIHSLFPPTITRSYSTFTKSPQTSTTVESALTQQEVVAVYEKGSDSASSTPTSYLYSRPQATLATTSTNGFIPTSTVPSEINTEWLEYLGQATKEYIGSIVDRIDQDRDGITEQEVAQLRDQHYQWLADRFSEINDAFTSALLDPATFDEANTYIKQDYQLMFGAKGIGTSLWQGIDTLIRDNRSANVAAKSFYADFEKAFTADSEDYMKEIENSIHDEQGFITDEKVNRYVTDMNNWLNSPLDFLSRSLDGLPSGIKDTLMETFQNKIKSLGKRYSDMIHQQVNVRNYPPKKTNPEDLFHYGKHPFEINVGTYKGKLMIQDATSHDDKSAFYLVDAKGVKKKVSIKFDNADLQSEFDKLFKKSTLGKGDKTISLEKLNKLLDKVKDGLKSISDTDLKRLASKLHGKEESEKLNKHVDDFLQILNRTLVR
ncbi:hypothetical protein ACQCN2_18275 [Brevibacillus ginsengisoli]|uniref:hypothetical protein n=1 Tax=Brevibacillus ginsengisoli TaxID=363854 RepID=UPI003CF06F0B